MSEEQISKIEQLTALEDYYDELKDRYKKSQEKVNRGLWGNKQLMKE